MFASRTTDTIPIPFADPPATCTVRSLTGRESDAAQAAHLTATIAGRFAAHGWAAQFQQQLAKGTATAADAEKVLADPLNGYDRHTIVKAGLLAWTIADPILPAPIAKPTDAASLAAAAARDAIIEDLTDEELEWFAREILRRTKPALFQTADEAAVEKKSD